ncbi:MAG: ACP S-malonyltransferase [Thermodesulfobacteriota bacterium]
MTTAKDSDDCSYALMFPGQGSQFAGMGHDLVREFAGAREIFQKADDLLGFALSRVMAGERGDELNRTIYTQPATFVHSMALWHVLQEHYPLAPVIAAGHSVGEFCALVASGMLGFAQALELIKVRAEGMDQAQPAGTCGMAAIIGLPEERVLDLVLAHRGEDVLDAANFNAPDQVVVSGHLPALDRIMAAVKTEKRTRTVMLPVSSAFHTSLMEPARGKLEEALHDVTLGDAQFPVVSNVTGATYPRSADECRQLIVEQVVKPVRWTACVQTMRQAAPATRFLEVGPGKVLTGLLRRIDKTAQGINISDTSGIRALAEAAP